MFDPDGKPVASRRLLLHELTFVKRGRDGTLYFLLDSKTPVRTKASGAFRPNALLPVVRTKALDHLRRRYEGRRVWTYGQLGAYRLSDSPQVVPYWAVNPGSLLRIARIYRLADTKPFSISGNPDLFVQGDSDLSARRPCGDGPYLTVFDSEGGTTRRLQATRFQSAPSEVIAYDWIFERVFSLQPPLQQVRRRIQRLVASGKAPYEAIPGLTHLEVAWFYGWPLKPIPLARMLKEPSWIYNGYAIILFEGDRATSHALEMPY